MPLFVQVGSSSHSTRKDAHICLARDGEDSLSYLIGRRMQFLRQLFDDWEPTLRHMRISGTDDALPPWGPEIKDKLNLADAGTAADDSEDDMDMDSEDEDEGERIALLLALRNESELDPTPTILDASLSSSRGSEIETTGQRPNKRTRVDNEF